MKACRFGYASSGMPTKFGTGEVLAGGGLLGLEVDPLGLEGEAGLVEGNVRR
jgi:hypothetical protein